MNYVIIDLEATCEKEKSYDYISEIIEIGAVKLDENGNHIADFNCFVKPTINPILSDFCKELTSISQQDVNDGLDRKTAFNKLIDFCGKDTILLSWGGYDKNQLRKEFTKFGLPTFILNNHKNLKQEFSNIINSNKQYGMAKALHIANIPLVGTHHRGIDDAKNIAKIFLKYKDKWDF